MDTSLRVWRSWALKHIEGSVPIILAAQQWRSPWMDAFWRIVAAFGDEPAFVLGLPLVLWNVSLCEGRRMCWMFAFLFYTGHSLKDVWQLPRPATVSDKVKVLTTAGMYHIEWGAPSTHAAASVAMPLYLTWLLWRGAHWHLGYAAVVLGCLVYATLISASRIYLGVHSVFDLLTGAGLGLSVATLFALVGDYVDDWIMNTPYAWFTVPVIFAAALSVYPRPKEFSTTYRDTAAIMGSVAGLAIGQAPGFFRNISLALWSAEDATTGAANTITSVIGRSFLGLVVAIIGHESYKRVVLSLVTAMYEATYGTNTTTTGAASTNSAGKGRTHGGDRGNGHMAHDVDTHDEPSCERDDALGHGQHGARVKALNSSSECATVVAALQAGETRYGVLIPYKFFGYIGLGFTSSLIVPTLLPYLGLGIRSLQCSAG